MGIGKLFGILCLLFTPALSFADEQAVRYCILKVRFGNEILAHRKPCMEGDKQSFEISGLQIKYLLFKRTGDLQLRPKNFVLFNGTQTQSVEVSPFATKAAIYDVSAESYVDGGLNQAVGVISFSVQKE